MDKVEEI